MADEKNESKAEGASSGVATAKAAGLQNEAKPKPKKERLFEVLTDQWGHTPKFVKGDLLWEHEIPYDFEWALTMGSIREAPEYEARKREGEIDSATQPLENQDVKEPATESK